LRTQCPPPVRTQADSPRRKDPPEEESDLVIDSEIAAADEAGLAMTNSEDV
jgi:hypothetical protein